MSGITRASLEANAFEAHFPGKSEKESHALFNTSMDITLMGLKRYVISLQNSQSVDETHDKPLVVFQEVFGAKSHLPALIKQTIGKYIPVETAIFSDRFLPYRDLSIKPFGSGEIHLTDPKVLKSYLGRNCQSQVHLEFAQSVATRIYKAPRRLIGDRRFGFAFPMNPEVLAYAMERLQENSGKKGEKIVVEIGGASGENAVLLACTDASKVINIELDPDEALKGEALKMLAPNNVKRKLEFIEGNCFDLLKLKPGLKKKVDLIFCRNVIHFFALKEQIGFIKLIKTMLKPGGRGIFSANCKYRLEKSKKFFEKHPDATCVDVIQCYAKDLNISEQPCFNIYYEVSLLPNHLYAYSRKFTTLYERTKETGFKWKVDNEAFNTLDPALQLKIKKGFARKKKRVQAIKHGNVEVDTVTHQVYDEHSLSRLFRSQGLEVEATGVLSEDGHMVRDNAFGERSAGIVIVCKKPE